MWTRDWRTSLPRGSSQRSCRKHSGVAGVLCSHPAPWHTSRISPALQTLALVPVPKGCWRKHPSLWQAPSTPPRARLVGEGWDTAVGCRMQGACGDPSHGREQWGSTHEVPHWKQLPLPGWHHLSWGVWGLDPSFWDEQGGNAILSPLALQSSPYPMFHLSSAPRLQRPARDLPLWPPLALAPSRRKLGIFLPSRNPNPAAAHGVRRSLREAPPSQGAGARCSVTFYGPPARRARRASR